MKEAVLAAAAGLAQRGETGDVVGGAIGHMLRAGGDAIALGAAYESLLGLDARAVDEELEIKPSGGTGRKRLGAFYTPEWLVEFVLDAALEPLIEGAGEDAILSTRILDPACGAGAFLVGAGERLAARLARVRGGSAAALHRSRRDVAARCLFGIDKDPVAVELCRGAIEGRLGPGSRIVQGDGLLDEPPGGGGFDAVLGNPPFLNRLERLTEVDRGRAAALKEQFGIAARAYTDASALFLLRGLQVTRAGGRVSMVQPQSLLGSRDAAGVRAAISAAGTLTELWLADEHVFEASVFVCVPTIEVGSYATGEQRGGMVKRSVGNARRSIPVARAEESSWVLLGAVNVPEVRIQAEGTISDLAEVTADFRDEYYGLRGRVVEHREGLNIAEFPALVSTGLIDPGVCRWGSVPCRFAGEAWRSPRVEVARLEPKIRAWAARRLVPKLLLATQTRVLETAVDQHGEWLPVTPLISIVPRKRATLWKLGASLSSPVLSAAGARMSAGTGLTRGAIKLSATQVRGLPMPAGDLTIAAKLFRKATEASEANREQLLVRTARESCAAYGVGKRDMTTLMEWWLERIRRQ